LPDGRESREFIDELAVFVEQFFGLVTLHPGLKNLEMLRIFTDRRQRDLMRSECAFDGDSIHFLRAGPSLRRAEDNHGPDGLLFESALTSLLLNSPNLGVAILKRLGQELMHDLRVVALDKVGLVTPLPT
jgi:hypothetical protein